MSEQVKHHTADKDIQTILGGLLRTGVIVSMSVVLLGGIIYLFEHSGGKIAYDRFNPSLTEYDSIPVIFKGLLSFKSSAIIQFGILLLIFTPIMRIVFAVYNFVLERDYMYVIIGIIVLGIITISLNGGMAH